MKETKFEIKNLESPLFDIDVKDSNFWVGITGYTEKNRFQYGTHVHFGSESYELSREIRNPFIRIIDEENTLVFGRTKQYNETNDKNAWIIDSKGEIKSGFSTGGAVENIVVTKNFIVVAYFDEDACYGEGVEVYNFEGELLFGYEGLFGKEAVDVSDCYAAALVEENKIIFCPYTEFQLVLFDIETKTQQVWETPAAFHGFSTISKLGDKIYFHLKYELELEGYDFGIYEWKIGSKEMTKIAKYENYFTRGLPDGRFIAKTDSGYSIISLQ